MDKNNERNGIEAVFKEIISNRMEKSGKMNKIESDVRAMVLNEIRDGDPSPISMAKSEKTVTKFANHLVLEYLEWMNFQYTKDLFGKESGTEISPSSRSIVEAQVDQKQSDFDQELPVLMTLAIKLMKK